MKLIIIAFSLIFVVLPPHVSATTYQDDKEIFDLALATYCKSDNSEKVIISIDSEIIEKRQLDNDSHIQEAFDNLFLNNKSSKNLPENIMCSQLIPLTENKIEKLLNNFNKRINRKRHPENQELKGNIKEYPNVESTIGISFPGYSQDGLLAVIYMTDFCGPLCASGNYLLLQKTNGHWIIVKTIGGWIS